MQSKSCPSCGAVVPVVAYRCKECFADLTPPKPKAGPIALLVALAGIGLMSAGTYWFLTQQRTDERILFDEASRSVQWVQTFADGRLETDRLTFDQVSRLRFELGSGGEQRIVAITTSGEEKVIERAKERQLGHQAERYAEVMAKPLEIAPELQRERSVIVTE